MARTRLARKPTINRIPIDWEMLKISKL